VHLDGKVANHGSGTWPLHFSAHYFIWDVAKQKVCAIDWLGPICSIIIVCSFGAPFFVGASPPPPPPPPLSLSLSLSLSLGLLFLRKEPLIDTTDKAVLFYFATTTLECISQSISSLA
jgi:hypothetical protein